MSKKQQILKDLKPQNEFFIGIDSDGCVFDTMEIKQKECFCPNFIKYFGMQKVSKYARETWEFVNLYSKTRGINRFLALIEAFRLLEQRPEVKARNMEIPDHSSLVAWTKNETKLGNPALKEFLDDHDDDFLELTYKWSLKVNEDIADLVKGMPPFPFVKESLEKISGSADSIVVSQTPVEALEREWEENEIDHFVQVIAGQEYGTKTEHIAYAAKGKYPDNKILMIGDAPGDMKAAKSNDVLFYPVLPGDEEESWERFYNEALDRFLNNNYKGKYEESLIREFNEKLPEHPHWK